MAVSAALGIAGLAIAAYGAIHQAQAEKRAKANLANRPVYTPLPEDTSSLNLAASQAELGMGAGARQAYQRNIDRSLATGANAIMMGGGDPNAIANLVDRSQANYQDVARYDDAARQQHLGMLLNEYNRAYNIRQGNADKTFQINQYAPWADRQQLYAQQMQGGQQTMNSGIGIAARGFSGLRYGQGGGGMQGTRTADNISGIQPLPTASLQTPQSGYTPSYASAPVSFTPSAPIGSDQLASLATLPTENAGYSPSYVSGPSMYTGIGPSPYY